MDHLLREKENTFRPVVVACKTLEKELHAAMEQVECAYPVYWIESGLHNTPARLNAALDAAMDHCSGFSHVLLAMGFCGNSIVGVSTRDSFVILPRVDDCISLLLGSMDRRSALNAEGLYFFTEGWLRGERTILVEYQYALKKYGPKRANAAFSAMLRHYRSAALLDTGCFDVQSARAETKQIAQILNLEYCEIPATLDHIKQLLTGPWQEDRFITIPPKTQISASHLNLKRDIT